MANSVWLLKIGSNRSLTESNRVVQLCETLLECSCIKFSHSGGLYAVAFGISIFVMNSYTNEAIFMFHATTLVFFTGFPAWQQKWDAIYYASYFADKTFNPFVPYPIVGFYFILLTLIIIGLFGLINRQLNKHLPTNERKRLKINKHNLIR